MTKKIFMLAIVLLAGTAMWQDVQAQTVEGKWKADEQFKENADLNSDEGFLVDFFLEFKKKNAVDLILAYTTSDEEMGSFSMGITMEGTYKQKKGNYTVNFNHKDLKFSILSMDLKDKEAMELMQTMPEMRQMIENMLMAEIKKSFEQNEEVFKSFAEMFGKFKVESVTKKKLTLLIEDEPCGFDRVE